VVSTGLEVKVGVRVAVSEMVGVAVRKRFCPDTAVGVGVFVGALNKGSVAVTTRLMSGDWISWINGGTSEQADIARHMIKRRGRMRRIRLA
jgi:hypothetical protein